MDRNILDVLDIRVEEDELIIDVKPGYSIYRTTEFRLDIEMPALEKASIAGSGEMRILDSFTGDRLVLSIAGSGNIRAKDFECEDVELNIVGSGSAIVSVEDTLDVVITGSGSVYYYGSPDLDKTVTGSGSIQNWGS